MTTTMMPAVDRVAASEAAVRARRARAGLKHALATGGYGHLEAIDAARDDSSDEGLVAATLKVSEFLMTLPFVGCVKRDRMMEELRISQCKRLGGLGSRQARDLRQAVSAWLAGHPVPGPDQSTAAAEEEV